jgi:hypothetical protein
VTLVREARRPGRLLGRRIFLSASVPSRGRAEKYKRVEDAHLEIDEAVISLARAVFSEDGTLVFGGHPAISPLVAIVAGEYHRPRAVDDPAENAEESGERFSPLVHIYQSQAFEGYLPDETLMMFRLGHAVIHWTEAVDGERFDPEAPRSGPPCPESTRLMRERMLREMQPTAMVCIGGMEGVEQEFEMFREIRRGFPVYIFERTGGAAAILAKRDEPGVQVLDRDVLSRLRELRRDAERPPGFLSPDRRPEPAVMPYPLIAQILVRQLAGGRGWDWR